MGLKNKPWQGHSSGRQKEVDMIKVGWGLGNLRYFEEFMLSGGDFPAIDWTAKQLLIVQIEPTGTGRGTV